MGLANLPDAKWDNVGTPQPILKSDFQDIEAGILAVGANQAYVPRLTWLDNTAVRVLANSDLPAGVLMSGFPNIMHCGQMATFGFADGKYRENTSNIDMDFDSPTNFWGSEKTSQWYAVFAVAGDSDATFTLKAMPLMRFSSQGSQVITLRNNLNTADIGYGFTTDSLSGYKILILSGASFGLIRSITANNNNDATGGTITYGGTALSMTQGDWFIVIPDTNFRWLGDIYNDASGHIAEFTQIGNEYHWSYRNYLEPSALGSIIEIVQFFPPLAKLADIYTDDAHGNAVPPDVGWSGTVESGASRLRIDTCKLLCGNTVTAIYCWSYIYPPGFL